MSYLSLIENAQIQVFKNLQQEWYSSAGTEWYDYIVSLPKHLQVAYLVVIYHNQVLNGGHDQWFTNHYGQFATETIQSLKLIGGNNRASLLEQSYSLVNHTKDADEKFRKRLRNRELEIFHPENPVSVSLSEIDMKYYAIDDESEDIEKLVGLYLSAFINDTQLHGNLDNQSKINEFEKWALDLIKARSPVEAFDLIASELDKCDDNHLIEYAGVLNTMRSPLVLDWIEKQAHRITNVSDGWGHLAASANFNWETAERWLDAGRPLSLIALNALVFCTTIGERLNQSLWMRENQPKLLGYPGPEIIAQRLNAYLCTDSVHRTKKAVGTIIDNIFDARQSQ